MASLHESSREVDNTCFGLLSGWLRMAFLCLPLVAISLFHKSHKEAYNFDNVKVTYALFCCTNVV
jgi:hypothetical protein